MIDWEVFCLTGLAALTVFMAGGGWMAFSIVFPGSYSEESL